MKNGQELLQQQVSLKGCMLALSADATQALTNMLKYMGVSGTMT